MIQIGEFFLAELLLGLSTIAFLVQIIRWIIDFDSPLLRVFVRSVILLLVLGMNAYLGLVAYRIKGNREWSNLSRPKEKAEAARPGECEEVAHGSQLMKYADKYNVGFVCGIPDLMRDQFEDDRISVSQAYSIHSGDIPMAVRFSQPMINGISKILEGIINGLPGSSVASKIPPELPIRPWNKTVLFSKTTKLSEIQRLSDIPKHGGKILSDDVH